MALRLSFRLKSGEHAIPLARVHAIVGYATLRGERDHYFRGWLCFHGEWVPVFDLNCLLCEDPSPETFGTRIILARCDDIAPVRLIGLLAAGVTDTVAAGDTSVALFNLDDYLPVLMNLIPDIPAVAE
jgi:chemotaxis signal transduction protein